MIYAFSITHVHVHGFLLLVFLAEFIVLLQTQPHEITHENQLPLGKPVCEELAGRKLGVVLEDIARDLVDT